MRLVRVATCTKFQVLCLQARVYIILVYERGFGYEPQLGYTTESSPTYFVDHGCWMEGAYVCNTYSTVPVFTADMEGLVI